MTTFERVTYRPVGERARTIYLRDPQVSGSAESLIGEFLTGIEVDREGTELAPKGVDERRHVISLPLVTRRVPVRVDLTYGTLEEQP